MQSTHPSAPVRTSSVDVIDWQPEDDAFWESTGKKIAYRNLWISVPALLCGFAVWGMWGIITVQMLNLGFPFTQAELFTLTAIAGIAGATMRIPASFLIRLAGGRNTIFLTTAMLLSPAIGTGIALQHKDWPLWAFQLMALWSGVGGGNFASSMSNISTFFPKRLQGTALGLNAGLGNFGVTTMQIVIPLAMTVGLFGTFAGEPMTLLKDSGWIFGKIVAGTPTWIQNAGFAWVLSLVPLSALCWFGMNNLKTVSPDTGTPIAAFAKIIYLYSLAFVPAIAILYLYLPAPTGLGLINMWVAVPLDVISALLVMRLAAFGTMKENVARQFAIFRDKHTWSMTLLYIVTFGSFIGFSMALPLSITVIFGISHVPDANGVLQHTLKNPNAPSAFTYAWIGPFVGAAIRPVGGWISDKLGGSIVTQVISAVMVVSSIAVGYVMMQAYASATPEQYFPAFLGLFIVLFAASGIGNGSTFRTIGVIFDRQQAGPVLGWTSAIAAYGAFIAPVVIGQQIKAGTPEIAMYGFAAFYALCLVLNWWFYLRANAYVKNP
ncbi:MAG: NarK/NasA family nitrate transporter [Candidatus Accumulibacter phosphatis]|uniref:Nitrate/nitrite transporter n=1 Tax=Candidatus Accumulibacter phosphatis TaxID=327160 RepID=A0A5S4EMQ3_9PROT|nr:MULTISPECIES: MFS transporter [Candidatus Accumulibacter]MBN8516508.1 NarK/NasA family nitrate transporter [Accumulibacter sp.]MBO3713293.1 NarK/NasA family nitrate transporter [Accumulibacter sp.]MCQ1551194.1 NarK/NasA family nitrate transporter [Candidatus Accumulibacter phosphatis]TMQ76636.1 Nitrate/nitrite transporter [Candidatus Accumulibacter phosphatis]